MTNAETAKEKFETEAKQFRQECEIARKTKEAVLEEKNDMTKKHEVCLHILLFVYFFLRLVNRVRHFHWEKSSNFPSGEKGKSRKMSNGYYNLQFRNVFSEFLIYLQLSEFSE